MTTVLAAETTGGESAAAPVVWKYTWTPSVTPAPKAEICKMKYGKRWGYAIEFDDGGVFAKTVALPLLSQFKYTDAPPGVKGGESKPFVAGVAVMPVSVGGNRTILNWNDIKELEKQGWGVINHSYWHTGCHWDPKKKLSPEQFRRELFWSQTLLGQTLYDGKHACWQLVYPNGDFNYAPYLKEFGLRYGSHVGGKDVMPYKKDFNPLRVKRSFLDEGTWQRYKCETMCQFPKDGPADAMLFIDFTHRIHDPDTENHKRWTQRLTNITKAYGQGGKDELWCAPSYEILNYVNAVQTVKLNCTENGFTLSYPADMPQAALTIRLEGVGPDVKLPVPEGGKVYRQGTTAWVTAPPLGQAGPKMPEPHVQRVFQGPYASEIKLEKPVRLAAVRIFQQGKPTLKELPITLTTPEGKTIPLNTERVIKWVQYRSRWGYWNLFPTLPDEKAPLVSKITLPAGEKCLKKVEVWAVEEDASTSQPADR